MKRLFHVFLAFVSLFASRHIAFAQVDAAAKPTISFAEVNQLPLDTLVSVPVYINTHGQKLDSLQVKIDIVGEVDKLDAYISSQIPVQEINRVVTDSSIFVTITSLDIGKNWSTDANTELLTISFARAAEGTVSLTFDQENTVAASDSSDTNVLQVGKSAVINFGEITPSTNNSTQEEDEPASATEPAANQPANEMQQKDDQDTLLVVVLIASLIAAGALLFFIFKSRGNATPV